jgi:hypothetical protein
MYVFIFEKAELRNNNRRGISAMAALTSSRAVILYQPDQRLRVAARRPVCAARRNQFYIFPAAGPPAAGSRYGFRGNDLRHGNRSLENPRADAYVPAVERNFDVPESEGDKHRYREVEGRGRHKHVRGIPRLGPKVRHPDAEDDPGPDYRRGREEVKQKPALAYASEQDAAGAGACRRHGSNLSPAGIKYNGR